MPTASLPLPSAISDLKEHLLKGLRYEIGFMAGLLKDGPFWCPFER